MLGIKIDILMNIILITYSISLCLKMFNLKLSVCHKKSIGFPCPRFKDDLATVSSF